MKTLFIILALSLLVACGGGESITIEDEDSLIAYEELELECIMNSGRILKSTYEDLETGIITYEGQCYLFPCEQLAVDEDVSVLPERCDYLKPDLSESECFDIDIEGSTSKKICGKSYT